MFETLEFVFAVAVILVIVGIAARHPLALWIAEVLVMGAVFGLVKEIFGVKGRLYGSTGRPRIRR
jgi:hypothetical protein